MSQCSSDVLTNIYNFILIDIQILLIFLNHFKNIKKFLIDSHVKASGRIYRLGTVNSNTVNSKFHLIQSFFEIFARFLSFHV